MTTASRPKRKDAPKRRGTAPGTPGVLDDELRTEIVTRLAMYDTVAEIQQDLAERGINVSHQAISHYKPGNERRIAQQWIDLFNETRKQYEAEIAAVPIGNRVWRLRQLQALFEKSKKAGEILNARQCLEQAAKESGGQYTNTTKVSGKVEHEHRVEEVTPEERRNMLADRLKEGLAARRAAATKH